MPVDDTDCLTLSLDTMSYKSAPYFLTAGAASLSLFLIARSIQGKSKKNPWDHVVPSPLKSLSNLPAEEISKLPYPPDLFPGARDVDTPYGSIRVYEWGPESGKKVLLVHGISTPCMSLGSVAEKLVESGCRVMMFGELLSLLYCCKSVDQEWELRYRYR